MSKVDEKWTYAVSAGDWNANGKRNLDEMGQNVNFGTV